MNKIIKVEKIEEKPMSDSERRQKMVALILQKCPLPVSLFFIQDSSAKDNAEINPKIIEEITSKTNLVFKNGNFYDENGNMLESDIAIKDTLNELTAISKRVDLSIANLIKSILQEQITQKTKEPIEKSSMLSVDDLRAKLFDAESTEKKIGGR